MRTGRAALYLPITVLALVALLAAGVPAGQAAGSSPTKVTLARGIGVSETTGHVFVLQDDVSLSANAGPQPSWVTMLDARTSKVLRLIFVGTDGVGLLTDNRTNRVFVIHGGYAPASRAAVTTLDARTGAIVRRTACGTGAVLGPVLAPGLARLYVVTNSPNGFLLHELDATTGKHLRQARISTNTPGVAVAERAGLVFVPSVGSVQVYDLRTLKFAGRFSVPFASPRVAPDEQYARVLVVAGKGFDRLDAFANRTWKSVSSRPLNNGMITSIHFSGSKVFAVSQGSMQGQTPTSNGTVSMLDRASLRVLGRTEVGAMAGTAVVDEGTHHLFVPSGGRLHAPSTAISLITTIDTRTGKRMAEVRLADTVSALVTDAKNGLVFGAASGGTGAQHVRVDLVVLDAKTGALLRIVALNGRPRS